MLTLFIMHHAFMFWLHSCLPWHALSPGLVVLLSLALLIRSLAAICACKLFFGIVRVVYPGWLATVGSRKGGDTRRTIEEQWLQGLQHLNPLLAAVQQPPQCLATGWGSRAESTLIVGEASHTGFLCGLGGVLLVRPQQCSFVPLGTMHQSILGCCWCALTTQPRVSQPGVGVDDLLKGCAHVAAPQTAFAGFCCSLSHFLLLTLSCSTTCMALTRFLWMH